MRARFVKSISARLLTATGAPNVRIALTHVAQLFVFRLWSTLINCFPIELNLQSARLIGNIWWLASRRHRERAIEHLQSAMPEITSKQTLRRIARGSFEHFAQLYLVELLMAPRLVSAWSWRRNVEFGDCSDGLRAMLQQRGCILLTGHFGNYELLGYTLSRLGLPMTAIMRPLDNRLLTDEVVRSRTSGGMRLIFKKGATEVAVETVRAGGLVSFIADQDAGSKGVFVDYFGKPASVYKSIALLAMAHHMPIVVGAAVRIREGFQYRIIVERVIQPSEWEGQADPLHWVTQEYTHAIERMVRQYPEQYLWLHRRWKSQPGVRKKKKRAAEIVEETSPT